jgi:hypothetical protein
MSRGPVGTNPGQPESEYVFYCSEPSEPAGRALRSPELTTSIRNRGTGDNTVRSRGARRGPFRDEGLCV